MSSQYPKDWKNCVTCEYWAGSRQPADNWGNRVEVESPMSRGRCMNRQSGWFYSGEKQANSSCQSWERWRVLDSMK